MVSSTGDSCSASPTLATLYFNETGFKATSRVDNATEDGFLTEGNLYLTEVCLESNTSNYLCSMTH